MRTVLGQISLPPQFAAALTTLYGLFGKVDRELAKNAYRGEATWDPGLVLNGAQTAQTIDVPDARVGDHVKVFPPYTLAGSVASGYVSADNVVTVVLANVSGSSIDLGSGTWRVIAEKW